MTKPVLDNPIEFQQSLKKRPRIGNYRVIIPIEYKGRRWKAGRTVQLRDKTAIPLLEQGKIILLPKPKFQDVFEHGLKLPERVVILGSGPRGKQGYDKIDDDDFVISLNGAITCPVNTTLWMAMDPTLQGQKYFRDLMEWHYNNYYLTGHDLTQNSIGLGYPIPVMEKLRVARYFPWVRCTFELRKPEMMRENNVAPGTNYLRPGCTVAGAAIQLAYLTGSKKIALCGIDMYGNTYHDGSRHKQLKRKDNQWSTVPVFNSLMRHLEKLGLSFTTLSATKLDVKHE